MPLDPLAIPIRAIGVNPYNLLVFGVQREAGKWGLKLVVRTNEGQSIELGLEPDEADAAAVELMRYAQLARDPASALGLE